MQDRKGSDSGYLVPGTWYLVPDTRYRINAEGRTPSTEDRARPPENAHTGFASCILILHPASCILHPVSRILHPASPILYLASVNPDGGFP